MCIYEHMHVRVNYLFSKLCIGHSIMRVYLSQYSFILFAVRKSFELKTNSGILKQ